MRIASGRGVRGTSGSSSFFKASWSLKECSQTGTFHLIALFGKFPGLLSSYLLFIFILFKRLYMGVEY